MEFMKEANNRLDKSHTPAQKPLLARSRKHLNALKKHLVLVPADEAANNIILVCKRLYIHTIRTELTQDDGAYAPATETLDAILENHRKALAKWGLPLTRTLPFMYPLPKMHKPKMAFRFIAASATCSVKIASQILGKMLTCVSRSIRKISDEILIKTGIRKYFVIKDGFEASDFLSSWHRSAKTKRPRTFDFSTLYTAIPLEDLKERVTRVVDEAWEAQGESKYSWMLQVNNRSKGTSGATWVDSKQTMHKKMTEHIFSYEEMIELLCFVIDNSFVSNGKTINIQTCGVPMGTNSAPDLANLYLYSY
jgi:hypothetical protein